jgi:hypothetical protein
VASHPCDRERTDRTLTIDPRIRRIGFAVFDAAILEEWAVKNVRRLTPAQRVTQLLIPALTAMLERFEPTVLLVPAVRSSTVRRSNHVRAMIRAVTHEARERNIAVIAISDAKVKTAFQRLAKPNKLNINRVLIEWFPPIRDSLPKARKLWESERYFTPLFHAIAMYCAWQGMPDRGGNGIGHGRAVASDDDDGGKAKK